MQVAARLPVQTLSNCPDYGNFAMPGSDAIMQRAISMQIKLGWTPKQLEQRIQATVKALKTIV